MPRKRKEVFIKEHSSAELTFRSRRDKEDDCAHGAAPLLVRRERPTRRNPRLLRPMRFASLHHHSTYSFLDGFQLPDAHVRRISELNGSALALTEHGNVMSHAKFEQAAAKEGNKPIFGIELY